MTSKILGFSICCECRVFPTSFARLIAAVLERENLALSDLARAWPEPARPLHGRLKRLGRFLDNPHLDETALFVRWLNVGFVRIAG